MLDVIALVLLVVLSAVALLYVQACDGLKGKRK